MWKFLPSSSYFGISVSGTWIEDRITMGHAANVEITNPLTRETFSDWKYGKMQRQGVLKVAHAGLAFSIKYWLEIQMGVISPGQGFYSRSLTFFCIGIANSDHLSRARTGGNFVLQRPAASVPDR